MGIEYLSHAWRCPDEPIPPQRFPIRPSQLLTCEALRFRTRVGDNRTMMPVTNENAKDSGAVRIVVAVGRPRSGSSAWSNRCDERRNVVKGSGREVMFGCGERVI